MNEGVDVWASLKEVSVEGVGVREGLLVEGKGEERRGAFGLLGF